MGSIDVEWEVGVTDAVTTGRLVVSTEWVVETTSDAVNSGRLDVVESVTGIIAIESTSGYLCPKLFLLVYIGQIQDNLLHITSFISPQRTCRTKSCKTKYSRKKLKCLHVL